jgi:beta-mannosidase
MRFVFFFLVSLVCKFSLAATANDTLILFQSAHLLRVDSSEIFPAKIPGSIYSDLFRNKKIPDPFYGANEKTLKWIEKENWIYIDTFLLSTKQLEHSEIFLLLEGIDTYADVYLNDKKIFSSNNMFVENKVDVKNFCRQRNILKVHIRPVDRLADSLTALQPFKLPGGNRVYTRKAALNFGWDFAPDLRGGGITKPVKLIFGKQVAIESIRFYQTALIESMKFSKPSPTNSLAECKFELIISSHSNRNAIIKLNSTDAAIDEIKYCELKKGRNTVTFDIKVVNPELWTTNGNGRSRVYNFDFTVLSNDSVFCTKDLNVGFRNLKLVQEKDSIGKSFYFVLNGIKTFCKGANVVPPEYFTGEATDSSWIALVEKAADMNMNMLRIWGGGVYPPEAFYDACDRRGILVWQDFMFACAMYPGDSAFLNSVAIEAEQAILKYRNHPSLALWCGNNENIEGWHNWGWQKEFNYSKEDSVTVISNYEKLFAELLKDQVEKFDGSTPYWPSSPSIGWGRKESMTQGDSHYWGVWWGMEPFEIYKTKVPRFMSEYGFQSLPAYTSILKFAGSSVTSFFNPGLRNHQKHPKGFETIDAYMNDHFIQPKDFRSKIYLSNILQAKGMNTAILAHRSGMPNCMGSLLWQLNDCWPGISWSLFDYYGTEKAAAYQVKRDFGNVILNAELNNDFLLVKVISDVISFPADLTISLIDFDGNVRWTERSGVNVKENSVSNEFSKSIKFLKHLYKSESAFIAIEISYEGNSIYTETICFVEDKDLKLKRPSVSMKRLEVPGNKLQFEISVNTFARNVELSIKDDVTGFSDNYFDMIPDRKYFIEYSPDSQVAPGDGLNVRSLVDTY